MFLKLNIFLQKEFLKYIFVLDMTLNIFRYIQAYRIQLWVSGDSLIWYKKLFQETEILLFETMAGKCLLHINSGMKYPTDNPLTLLTLLGIPVTC